MSAGGQNPVEFGKAEFIGKKRSFFHLARWLAHPLTRGLDLDDPRTTELRRRVIREKPFLRRVYREWYRSLAASLPPGGGPVLELGSGAGFLGEYVPGLLESDVIYLPGIDVVLDGQRLPFCEAGLRGMLMLNVLHHLPRLRLFFAAAARCVRPGGALAMVEPWVTPWSRLVYTKLHHEPFQPEAADWTSPPGGPLSGGNGALPWIVFGRDRARFDRDFPQWRVRQVRPLMPFRYLVSGGVSLRSLAPGWSFVLWRGLERLLLPWSGKLAMFAQIVLLRTEVPWKREE